MGKHLRIIALAALLGALYLLRAHEPAGVDQGLFLCFARWVPRGWLPYRDLFDSKPPLFLYWYGLVPLFGHVGPAALWRLETVWLAATAVPLYLLARRVGGSGVVAVVAFVASVAAPAWDTYWSRAQAEELQALPLAIAALWAFTRPAARATPFVVGVLTGVAGLFKIPGMAAAAAWPLAWRRQRPMGRAVVELAAGIALPWALAFGWFAAHGATRDFVDGVFRYHRYNAAFITPPWGSVLATFARAIVDGVPELAVAAMAGVVVLAVRRASVTLPLATWIAAAMASVVLQRQLAPYHYVAIVLPLALAAGIGIAALAARVVEGAAWQRALAGVVLAALTVLAMRQATRWSDAYAADFDRAVGRIGDAQYLAAQRRGSFAPDEEVLLADYLGRTTAPGDGVLIWGLAPGVYALADRHPTTRYPFHKILYTDAPLSAMMPGLDERRRELMARLERDPPRVIAVGQHDENGFEPEPSDVSLRRFAALDALVRDDYVLEPGTIGRYLIYRRR